MGRYKTYILILICTVLLICAALPRVEAQANIKQARSADSFVDSIGINTHLNNQGRIYDTGYDTIIKPKILELGLRRIRDNVTLTSQKAYYTRVNDLGQAGIKFTYICGKPVENDMNCLEGFVSKVSGAVAFLEGPNEPDLFWGSDWVDKTRTFQQALYKKIKGSSLLMKFPVLGPSIVRNHDLLGDISAYLDYGNHHFYIGGSNPGKTKSPALNKRLAYTRKNSGSKPIMVTEFGYHNVTNPTGSFKGAPEDVAGKYIPRSYLFQFNRGVVQSFNYELIDEAAGSTDKENNFGLLRYDGSPKPAFTALKNLISLLKDPGPSFTPGSLDYTLSGSTTDVQKTLLQKRDGRFYLILWVEKRCYDPTTNQRITVPSQQVTLSLNTPISKVETYLPNSSINGTLRVISKKRVVLKVPDHPLVVELTPVATVSISGGTSLKSKIL